MAPSQIAADRRIVEWGYNVPSRLLIAPSSPIMEILAIVAQCKPGITDTTISKKSIQLNAD